MSALIWLNDLGNVPVGQRLVGTPPWGSGGAPRRIETATIWRQVRRRRAGACLSSGAFVHTAIDAEIAATNFFGTPRVSLS
jgi:hypothetical protein